MTVASMPRLDACRDAAVVRYVRIFAYDAQRRPSPFTWLCPSIVVIVYNRFLPAPPFNPLCFPCSL